MIDVLTIPADAVALMVTMRPEQAYQRLMESRILTETELLTFAYLNTPISDSPIYDPDRIIAYVSCWEGGHLTVCERDGDMVTLLADEPGSPPQGPEQTLAIFRRHWPTDTTDAEKIEDESAAQAAGCAFERASRLEGN